MRIWDVENLFLTCLAFTVKVHTVYEANPRGPATLPIITANILVGRDLTKKRAFVRALTNAAVEALGAPIESVRVIINEMEPDHYGIAGVTVAEKNQRKQD